MNQQPTLFDLPAPAPRPATKVPRRELERQLRTLRGQWKAWTSGRAIVDAGWWGVPWCDHRRPVPTCEGCCTRSMCRNHARELEADAAAIKAQLAVTP